jgi:uncharacterized membrane protein
MADYEVVKTGSTPGDLPVTSALIAYALYGVAAVTALISAGGIVGAAPLLGLIGIVGVIVCYVKRSDAHGTWIESHLRWLIRTFWYSLLWAVIGGIFAITIIGLVVAIPVWAAASIWVLYRVIRGYLLFKDSRPIPGM